MRINPIKSFNNYIKEQSTGELCKKTAKYTGAMLLGSALMMSANYFDREELTNDIKKEVKMTGISDKDFKQLDDSISMLRVRDKSVAWQHALDSINIATFKMNIQKFMQKSE